MKAAPVPDPFRPLTADRSVRPRPFLKWAGGKARLLPELLARLPERFGAYHEPFLGGGALFFELHARGRLGKVVLSDRNPVLVETWQGVRDDVEGVISRLRRHRNEAEHYYRVRAQDPARLSLAARAARIIYMNRTCYNGLFRENRAGRFNVPFGRYRRPVICDAENLRAVSRALQGVDLEPRRFADVLDQAAPGDLVYFDPPYHPVSGTSSFTSYHRTGFGPDDQADLRDVFSTLARRGTHVVLSNSDTPLIRDLYRDFRMDRVWAARAINSRPDRRGKVPELIIRSSGEGAGGLRPLPR